MNRLILSVTLLLCVSVVHAGEDGKCRAMALAGGGDKGSY